MANEEQLAILRQGVEIWNQWRRENHAIQINLFGANLQGVDLQTAGLSRANLRRADLSNANLIRASLNYADLVGANLAGANLEKADLSRSNLDETNLIGANLVMASLRIANVYRTNLNKANLSQTTLLGTHFKEAHLVNSEFWKAEVEYTDFGRLDLSEAIGLEDALHLGPSSISTDTFALSKGKIPEVFLRGCGLSDVDIEHVKLSNPNLNNEEVNKILYRIYDLRATQAIQISPLFISYSHANTEFVNKLETQLNKKGIRFWRDIHDLKAGRIETQIDKAISQNRTVLLVISEASLKSDWVEHEVRTARSLEKDTGRDILCPIALDDSWKSSRWPKRVTEQIKEYNILDFSEWKDDVRFEGMFRKLIDGLELFYKG